jgi:protein disulfide-isomerase A1
LYFTSGEPDLTKEDSKPFVFSSEHHRGNAAFVTINIDGETGKEMADYFSVDTDGTLMAIFPVGSEEVDKYLYTGAWNKEDVQLWIQAFIDGKLEKHFKSEDIPADTPSPLKVLVGKNYEESVHNPNKHIFVEFYAPWCHHCKKVIDFV